MRCWVTLQKNRFRVSAIVAVSERVTENVGYQNEEFGFFVTVAGDSLSPRWTGYRDEDQAVAVLDDLHKLLNEGE